MNQRLSTNSPRLPKLGIDAPLTDEVNWLLSDEAEGYVRTVIDELDAGRPAHQLIARLRKRLPPARANSAFTLAELRRRARKKFTDADKLFFTKRGLEQATSDALANYKRSRFSGADSIVDLCCGIGGDLMRLGEIAETMGVEKEPTTAAFAAANATARNVSAEVLFGDVEAMKLPRAHFVHIDPDRRAGNQRTVDARHFLPSVEWLEQLRQSHPHLAIKMAPSTVVPESWLPACQREWIADRREVKQQMCWFGQLADVPPIGERSVAVDANSAGAGVRTATIVDDDGKVVGEFSSRLSGASVTTQLTGTIDRYLFEPHPVLLASQLADAFAERWDWKRLDSRVAYWTSDRLTNLGPLASCFEVLEVTKLDRKRVSDALAANDVGQIEVKRRGVPEAVQRRFERSRWSGSQWATLILTRTHRHKVAIVARRVSLDGPTVNLAKESN